MYLYKDEMDGVRTHCSATPAVALPVRRRVRVVVLWVRRRLQDVALQVGQRLLGVNLQAGQQPPTVAQQMCRRVWTIAGCQILVPQERVQRN